MKRGIVLLALVFSLSLISALSFGEITGRVVDELEDGLSNMSDAELIALYEENKDLVSDDQIDYIIEENKDEIPQEMFDLYENNSDVFVGLTIDEISIAKMIAENSDMSLAPLLNIFPCSMVIGFIEPEIVGTEIPKEVPLEDEVFNFYIDNQFIVGLELEDKVVSGLSCDENEEFDYQIFVTSELIVDVALNREEIDVIEFYKENKASGDLEIKAKGLMNKFKLFVLNIAVKFL